MTQKDLYLALDFDGVLHHRMLGPKASDLKQFAQGVINRSEFLEQLQAGGREAGVVFDKAETLAGVLDALERTVRIVVATSWRSELSLANVRELMPTSLAKRVVGMMNPAPELDSNRYPISGIRGDLMELWIGANAAEASWIALDDVEEYWGHHAEHLFHLPPPGFHVGDIDRFKNFVSHAEAQFNNVACA